MPRRTDPIDFEQPRWVPSKEWVKNRQPAPCAADCGRDIEVGDHARFARWCRRGKGVMIHSEGCFELLAPPEGWEPPTP